MVNNFIVLIVTLFALNSTLVYFCFCFFIVNLLDYWKEALLIAADHHSAPVIERMYLMVFLMFWIYKEHLFLNPH